MGLRIFIFAFLCLSAAILRAEPLDQIGRPADEKLVDGQEVRFKIDLAGAKDNVKLVKLKDGSYAYVVKRLGADNDRLLTPAEFAELYYGQQNSRGWVFTIFNITSPIGLAWVALGFGGQLLFTGRMLVQWFASEKSKRSVIPVSFWWMSLIGSTMVLVYFIWRRDVVGIVGQGLGWVVYVRNLVLIRRSRG